MKRPIDISPYLPAECPSCHWTLRIEMRNDEMVVSCGSCEWRMTEAEIRRIVRPLLAQQRDALNEGPKDIARLERQSAAWAAHIEPWQKGGTPMKPSDDISDARLAELVDLAAKCAEISKHGMRKDIDRDIWKALDELRRRRAVSVTQEEMDDWESP